MPILFVDESIKEVDSNDATEEMCGIRFEDK